MFKIKPILQDTLSCHGNSFGGAEARKLESHEKRIKELEDHVGLSPEVADTSKKTKVEYIKCEFKSAWEAVKAFEEGVELYDYDDFVEDCCTYSKIDLTGNVLLSFSHKSLYTIVETPWYEIVSEDKPVYIISSKGRVVKTKGSVLDKGFILKVGGGHVDTKLYKPLTKEQAKDIVDTMENYYV